MIGIKGIDTKAKVTDHERVYAIKFYTSDRKEFEEVQKLCWKILDRCPKEKGRRTAPGRQKMCCKITSDGGEQDD